MMTSASLIGVTMCPILCAISSSCRTTLTIGKDGRGSSRGFVHRPLIASMFTRFKIQDESSATSPNSFSKSVWLVSESTLPISSDSPNNVQASVQCTESDFIISFQFYFYKLFSTGPDYIFVVEFISVRPFQVFMTTSPSTSPFPTGSVTPGLGARLSISCRVYSIR